MENLHFSATLALSWSSPGAGDHLQLSKLTASGAHLWKIYTSLLRLLYPGALQARATICSSHRRFMQSTSNYLGGKQKLCLYVPQMRYGKELCRTGKGP